MKSPPAVKRQLIGQSSLTAGLGCNHGVVSLSGRKRDGVGGIAAKIALAEKRGNTDTSGRDKQAERAMEARLNVIKCDSA